MTVELLAALESQCPPSLTQASTLGLGSASAHEHSGRKESDKYFLHIRSFLFLNHLSELPHVVLEVMAFTRHPDDGEWGIKSRPGSVFAKPRILL